MKKKCLYCTVLSRQEISHPQSRPVPSRPVPLSIFSRQTCQKQSRPVPFRILPAIKKPCIFFIPFITFALLVLFPLSRNSNPGSHSGSRRPRRSSGLTSQLLRPIFREFETHPVGLFVFFCCAESAYVACVRVDASRPGREQLNSRDKKLKARTVTRRGVGGVLAMTPYLSYERELEKYGEYNTWDEKEKKKEEKTKKGRLFSPLPTAVRALHFYREKDPALSSLVDSRRTVLTHAMIGALD